jgi:hypothetical protein
LWCPSVQLYPEERVENPESKDPRRRCLENAAEDGQPRCVAERESHGGESTHDRVTHGRLRAAHHAGICVNPVFWLAPTHRLYPRIPTLRVQPRDTRADQHDATGPSRITTYTPPALANPASVSTPASIRVASAPASTHLQGRAAAGCDIATRSHSHHLGALEGALGGGEGGRLDGGHGHGNGSHCWRSLLETGVVLGWACGYGRRSTEETAKFYAMGGKGLSRITRERTRPKNIPDNKRAS